MECVVCKRGMKHGVTLWRINEKGVKGVWACDVHRPAALPHIDPELRKIVRIIEEAGESQ